jgi:signal peptidase II
MALIAGGAIGNLLDRIGSGYVTDYLVLRFFPPVFNLADIAITFGAAFLMLQLLRQEEE